MGRADFSGGVGNGGVHKESSASKVVARGLARLMVNKYTACDGIEPRWNMPT